MNTPATFQHNLKHKPGLEAQFRECLEVALETLNQSQNYQRFVASRILELLEILEDHNVPEDYKVLLDCLYKDYSSTAIPKYNRPEGWNAVQRACVLYFKNSNNRHRAD